MNGYYDAYDDVALEDIEGDEAFSEFFESDEELPVERRRGRRGGGRAPAPRGARGGGYTQPQSSSQNVTDARFQAAVKRIENDIKRLNEADKTINSRVNAANARLDRHAKAIKTENSDRKKADEGLKTTLVLTAAANLFIKPKSVAAPDSLKLEPGTKLIVEETDFLKTVAPMVIALFGGQLSGMLGGLGSGGSSSSSSSSSGL